MDTYRYVILGGGVVAGYAAQELAELDLQPGELCIVSADNILPYERPPLSKGFLTGATGSENLLINDEAFYREQGIDVRLNTRIEIVDLQKKRLRSFSQGEIGFDKLLIASGSNARRLSVPGAERQGVTHLHSLEDAQDLRMQAGADVVQQAVVVGGSYIAMEVAAALAQQGLEITMVVPETQLIPSLFTPEMSDFFQGYFAERGITMMMNVTPTMFTANGRVTGVRLKQEGALLPADLVFVGMGLVPDTEMFDGTGLMLDNGVLVNEFLETSVANVYAAGDIANYWDVLYNKQRRTLYWDTAVAQARQAARLLTNRRDPFTRVPYFSSQVFDLEWEFWGDPEGAHAVVQRGSIEEGSFSMWWLRKSRLIAAFVLNRPEEERELAPQWIMNQEKMPLDLLERDDLSLREPLYDRHAARRRE